MIRRIRRWRAERELDRVDADLARWLVDDGALSEAPLEGSHVVGGRRARLRSARLEAVRRLERAGGRDPAPCLLRPPTAAQRAAYDARRGIRR